MKVKHLLLGLPLLLYLLLPTRNFYWDGLAFAIDIEKPGPLWRLVHPNHLLYTVVAGWLYRIAHAAGASIRALYLMQAVNAVLAGACVVLVYRALRRKGISHEAGLAWALLFAFSATWWKFATDADAYVPSIFFLLCAYELLDRSENAYLAGLAQAGAMLFHELGIFFLPVAWVRLKDPRRRAVYVACTLLPVAAIYLLAYGSQGAPFTVHGFLTWVTAHAADSGFSFNPLRDLALSLRGTFRLFFGGRLTGVPPAVSVVVLATVAVAAVVFGLHLRRTRLAFAPPPRDVIVWAGVYAAFLFFWMPQNTFYRLFYLAPLVLIAGSMLRKAALDRAAAWLPVGVLLVCNFVFLIYPQSRVESNAPLRFALQQHDAWAPGTPIVFHRFHPDLWTISYFNLQASWIDLARIDLAQLNYDLTYAGQQKKPLWMEATAYDLLQSDAAGRGWLAAHLQPEKTLIFRDDKHEFRFYQLR